MDTKAIEKILEPLSSNDKPAFLKISFFIAPKQGETIAIENGLVMVRLKDGDVITIDPARVQKIDSIEYVLLYDRTKHSLGYDMGLGSEFPVEKE
ncbi:MAG TPA: hypothetical protein PLV72_01835 [Candidatus Magasanikbacteria bacterium]|nr:hypothetical protein [Candidatus Magasanikbacteria bacterium]